MIFRPSMSAFWAGGGTAFNLTRVTTLGSSTSYYNSVRTSATNGNIYGDGHLHHFLSLQGQSLGYIRDGSASATQGAGQYNFGVTGITLATSLSNGLVDRCLDAAQASGVESNGYSLVTAQIGPNDLANSVSAATILTYVEDLVTRAMSRNRVFLVLLQVPPRLDGAGEDLILVQRNLLNDGVLAAYGSGRRRVRVLEIGDLGDNGSGYMQTNLVDTLNHPEPFIGASVGGALWDLLSTDSDVTIPDPIDLNSIRTLYGRNTNILLAGTSGAATGWATSVSGASTYASALSFEDYPDASGRRFAVMAAAANGGNGYIRLAQSTGTLSAQINGGDIIEVFAEADYVQSGFTIGAVRINMSTGGPAHFTECGTSRTTIESPPVALPWSGRRRILRTMPLTASGTITTANGAFTNISVFGSGTVKVGTPVVAVNRPSPDYMYVP